MGARGNIDDTAPLLLMHRPDSGTRAVEGPDEDHVDDTTPVVDGNLEQQAILGKTRVVHQDVGAVPTLDLLDRSCHLIEIHDISRNARCTISSDLGSGRLDGRGIHVQQRDAGAVCMKGLSRRTPDATCRTGN